MTIEETRIVKEKRAGNKRNRQAVCCPSFYQLKSDWSRLLLWSGRYCPYGGGSKGRRSVQLERGSARRGAPIFCLCLMSPSVQTLVSGLVGEQVGYSSSYSHVLLCLSAVVKMCCPRKVPDICSDWPVRFGVNDICASQVTWCGQEDGNSGCPWLPSCFSCSFGPRSGSLILYPAWDWEQVYSRCKKSKAAIRSWTQGGLPQMQHAYFYPVVRSHKWTLNLGWSLEKDTVGGFLLRILLRFRLSILLSHLCWVRTDKNLCSSWYMLTIIGH